MVKALFDTNILIDYLNAVPEARDELLRYDQRAISIITWMEVLIGAPPEHAAATRGFLNGFDVIALDGSIAESAVALRQQHRIKLPSSGPAPKLTPCYLSPATPWISRQTIRASGFPTSARVGLKASHFESIMHRNCNAWSEP
jgi:hypothetical protein